MLAQSLEWIAGERSGEKVSEGKRGEKRKCGLMVDLIEKKNPEAAVNQQFQDLFSGDNR